MSTNNISANQTAGIAASIKAGRRLQQEHPEIGQMWIEGDSHSRLAEIFRTTHQAVGYAIAGHTGTLGIKPYEGLVNDKRVRKRIAREHNSKSATETNATRPTSEKAREVSRRNLISTIIKKGEVPMTPARDLYNFVVGTGFIKTGKFPSEREYIFELSRNPKYQHTEGSSAGKSNIKKIKREVNRVFHHGEEIRTTNTVAVSICRYKKKLLR